MKLNLSQPNVAALIGLLLCLPGALMLPMLMLGIEPALGPLNALLATPPNGPNVIGTAIALMALVVLPAAAGLLNAAPMARGMRAGRRLGAYPLNALIVAVGVAVIVVFAAGIVIDQYPCWIGVPNCD